MAKKLTDEAFELGSAGPKGSAGLKTGELLAAARQVFGERGFSGARIADDNYCWPVPMDELFVTLWKDHQAAHAAAASTAVAHARQSGVTDAGKLFEIGGRAFLAGSWHRRDLALLFASGDAPHGFASMRQHGRLVWLRRNATLLRLSDDPEDRLYTATLTSLIGRGAREVATAPDFRQAQTLIDAVIGYAALLVADRPRPVQRYAGLRAVPRLGC